MRMRYTYVHTHSLSLPAAAAAAAARDVKKTFSSHQSTTGIYLQENVAADREQEKMFCHQGNRRSVNKKKRRRKEKEEEALLFCSLKTFFSSITHPLITYLPLACMKRLKSFSRQFWPPSDLTTDIIGKRRTDDDGETLLDV